MITKEMVYEEKRQFVKKLEEALLCLDDIRGVEYRVSSKNFIELIRIDWHGEGDPHDYIVVTGRSLSQILCEVLSLIQESWAVGLVRDQRGDKLWDDLGTKMDRKDAD